MPSSVSASRFASTRTSTVPGGRHGLIQWIDVDPEVVTGEGVGHDAVPTILGIGIEPLAVRRCWDRPRRDRTADRRAGEVANYRLDCSDRGNISRRNCLTSARGYP